MLDFDGSFGIGSGYHISGHMRTDSGFEIWWGKEEGNLDFDVVLVEIERVGA